LALVLALGFFFSLSQHTIFSRHTCDTPISPTHHRSSGDTPVEKLCFRGSNEYCNACINNKIEKLN